MRAKDTYFYKKRLLNCRGKLLSLEQPVAMGILNVTPDSFYDGGSITDVQQAINRALIMRDEGAKIIDIGGCSSRPGSKYPGLETELERTIPVIRGIHAADPELIISIDTYHPQVAEKAIEAGASIINDISAGSIFPEILEVAVRKQVPYVLMHMQGIPETMQASPQYDDVISEVLAFLVKFVEDLRLRGIHDLIIDPGFGFGKNLEHNYELLQRLDACNILGLPILTGFSRKGMVSKALGVPATEALTGTTVLHAIALEKGASILRVHDVRDAVMAIKIHTFTS